MMKLVIGTRNYSSWSLRPWLAIKQAGLPFEEILIPLRQPATKADFPAGFLPAYGSGLAFKGKNADGLLEFYAITDRGPNGDGPLAPRPGTGVPAETKVFPAPSFTPSIRRA